MLGLISLFHAFLCSMRSRQKSWKVVSKYEWYMHKMRLTIHARTMHHARIAHIGHHIYKAHLLGVTKVVFVKAVVCIKGEKEIDSFFLHKKLKSI